MSPSPGQVQLPRECDLCLVPSFDAVRALIAWAQPVATPRFAAMAGDHLFDELDRCRDRKGCRARVEERGEVWPDGRPDPSWTPAPATAPVVVPTPAPPRAPDPVPAPPDEIAAWRDDVMDEAERELEVWP